MSSTKRVRFGSHVQSQSRPSTRQKTSGARSGSKATKKVKTKKKPEWDTTVSDLTVHKLTKEEIEKKRQSFLSKNADAAKYDLYEKAKGTLDLDSSGNLRPSPLSESSRSSRNRSKLAALQHSLHGKELHDVLAESDRTLAVVRDLFGDDPKRYTCQPNVTVAPHIVTNREKLERTILESSEGGPIPTAIASPGGIRDESILDLVPRKPALNELPSPSSAELEDDATLTADDDDTSEREESPVLTPQGRGYQPAIDLTRFQKLIESEDKPSSREKHRRKGHSNRPSGQSTNEEHQSVAHMDVQRQTDMPTTQSSSNHHRHHGSTFGWSRDQQSARLAHVEVGRQDIQEENESSSETGMSELSSIPPEIDSRVNTTVDSEVSSLHSHVNVSPSDQQAQPSGACGERASVRDRGVELGERERLVSSQAPSMPQHPLHIAHRMASVHRRDKEDGNADDRKHNVHGQLNTLEQMVQELEKELGAYERSNNLTLALDDITNTSIQQSNQSKPKSDSGGGSLGSITKSLLSSMTKMMSYLRQSEVQLKGEVAVRVQLLQTMTEQQNLMDSLTADLIKLRSENISLRQELGDLKKTSTEQIRKIQDDYADVNKKLSSLAVSQVHQAPPSHAYPYLSPQLPFLPPHLLQTPPSFLSSNDENPNQYDSIHYEQPPSPLTQHRDIPPPTSVVTMQAVSHSSLPKSVTKSTRSSAPSVGSPSFSPTILSHDFKPVSVFTKNPPHELSYKGKENDDSISQHRATSPLSGSDHVVARSSMRPAHFRSDVPLKHPSSSFATNPSMFAGALSSISSLAPPPPSLSVALQVPGFDMPPVTSHRQANTSTSTATPYSPSSSSGHLPTNPVFDVDAFINSLRKNQPHLSSVTKESDIHVQHLTGDQHTAPSTLLPASVHHPLSQSRPPSRPHKPQSLVQAPHATPEIVVPMVDLSVSLLSSVQGDSTRGMVDENGGEEETSISTEQSVPTTVAPGQEYSHFQSEIQTDSASTVVLEPPLVKRSTQLQPLHPSNSKFISMTGSNATHLQNSAPTGYMVQHQGLVHDTSKFKPGWFALHSHLSHTN